MTSDYAIRQIQSNTTRSAISDCTPLVFTKILEPEYNLAIWQRELPVSLTTGIADTLQQGQTINLTRRLDPEDVLTKVKPILAKFPFGEELSANIAELTEMYALLFGAEEIGLRLATLDRAMCPRFHVDHLGCRLITTFYGQATEWLKDDAVDRSQLGQTNKESDTADSPLYANPSEIQQMMSGEVALLKGAGWEGNEDNGVVHRSPAATAETRRLVLTIDFIS